MQHFTTTNAQKWKTKIHQNHFPEIFLVKRYKKNHHNLSKIPESVDLLRLFSHLDLKLKVFFSDKYFSVRKISKFSRFETLPNFSAEDLKLSEKKTFIENIILYKSFHFWEFGKKSCYFL